MLQENNKVTVDPEIYTISIFKDLSPNDFAYIYWMGDFGSPYLSIAEDEREKAVIEDCLKDSEWKVTEQVKTALNKYRELQELSIPALSYLNSARKAAEDINTLLKTINLKERDKSGKPIYKPKEIASAISELRNVVETLDKWDEKVRNSLSMSDEKIRGGGVSGMYEDAESANKWLTHT